MYSIQTKGYICGLQQSSRKWYLKFDGIVDSLRSVDNKVDQYMNLKVSENKFLFFILYMNVVLFANSDFVVAWDQTSLSKIFEMKDLTEILFMLSFKIHRNSLWCIRAIYDILELS